jgi:hypothetical protein
VRRFGWLVGLALVLGVGGAAQAQTLGDSELTKNWELRVGFFLPERESAREAGRDVWFSLGGERTFYEADRWKGTLSIDYYGAGGSSTIYNIPICLNARGASQGLRYGAGLGVSYGHDTSRGLSSLAYNLLVGYTLKPGVNPINVDLRYLGVTQSHGELNGWAMSVGFGF